MRRRLSKSGEGRALEAELGYDTGTTNSSWRFSTPPTRFLFQTIKSICGEGSEFCKRKRTRVGKLGGAYGAQRTSLTNSRPGAAFTFYSRRQNRHPAQNGFLKIAKFPAFRNRALRNSRKNPAEKNSRSAQRKNPRRQRASSAWRLGKHIRSTADSKSSQPSNISISSFV